MGYAKSLSGQGSGSPKQRAVLENEDGGSKSGQLIESKATELGGKSTNYETEIQNKKGPAVNVDSPSNNDAGDNDIPAFLTCNKCHMVFIDTQKAFEHEGNCTITMDDIVQRGKKVTGDKDELLAYMIGLYSKT